MRKREARCSLPGVLAAIGSAVSVAGATPLGTNPPPVTAHAVTLPPQLAGAEIARALPIDRVWFAAGGDVLGETHVQLLDVIATALNANPRFDIIGIVGYAAHVDDAETVSARTELSLRRSRAVVAALVARGVAPERLRVFAGGASLGTASAEASRRVQVMILHDQQGKPVVPLQAAAAAVPQPLASPAVAQVGQGASLVAEPVRGYELSESLLRPSPFSCRIDVNFGKQIAIGKLK